MCYITILIQSSVGFLITVLLFQDWFCLGDPSNIKMVSAQPMSGELNNSFDALLVSGGSESGQAQNGGTGTTSGTGTTLSGWKDLPMELLLRIISIAGDNRTVIVGLVASGVCTGWRDALGWGVTNLSLSW